MPIANALGDVALTAFLCLCPGGLLLSALGVFRGSDRLTTLIGYHVASVALLALFGVAVFTFNPPWPVARGLLALGLLGLVGLWWRRRSGPTSVKALLRSPIWLPLLSGLAFAALFLACFPQKELAGELSWSIATRRTNTYGSIDNVLQRMVAENLYFGRPIETGFNPDGQSVWSVGDRPMLLGLLHATLSVISETFGGAVFFTRTIYFGAFYLVALFQLLRALQIRGWILGLIFLVTALHPFFLTNLLFTWPKMVGLGFFLSGLALAAAAPPLAGLSLGLAVISHTMFVFSLPLVLIWTRSLKKVALVLAPVLVVNGLQSAYIKAHTNSSGLMQRVNLCKQGSYEYPTPPVSLGEACRKYFDESGVVGVLEDRRESLKRGLIVGYAEAADSFSGLLGTLLRGELPALQAVLSHYRLYQFAPPFIYGLWALPLFVMLTLRMGRDFLRRRTIRMEPDEAFFVSSFALLIGFLSLIAASNEISGHSVPYSLHVGIFVGALWIILNRWPRLGSVVAGGWIVLGAVTYYTIAVQPMLNKGTPWLFFLACGSFLALLASLRLQAAPLHTPETPETAAPSPPASPPPSSACA